MQFSAFLRTVLKIDAASCLGMAAITLPAAGGLQQPLGIESGLLTAAAASLVPIGLFILWLGTRKEHAAMLVWLVIIGNLGWTVASLFVAQVLPEITPLGQMAVAGQGFAVLALAISEWVGLRASMRAGGQLSA